MPSVADKPVRVSASKEVINKDAHDTLAPKYVSIVDSLVEKYPVTKDEFYEKLVNFKTNREQPIHGWFDYKQGYADALVQSLLDYSDLSDSDYVLDPFTGVGTTQVSAQQKGYKSIGIDINPIASLAAKTKTHKYTDGEIDAIQSVLDSIRDRYITTKAIPKYKKLTEIFTESQLDKVLKIKGFYESIDDSTLQNFFRLAYISIIEPVSNRVKDGNGIKISRTKKIIDDVFGYYEDKCRQMLGDIRHQRYCEATVIEGSLLDDQVFNEVKKHQVGSIIYSPPYANCFDYLEVYKMEVWLGGFVEDYDGFAKYRDIALRSHVNSKFSLDIKNRNSQVDTIADFIGTYNIWNKNIPSMLRGYFDDMHEIIRRSYAVSRSGALCAIVVANSGYKGVVIPTDLLLADIAVSAGYKVDKIIHARNIRSSSQQMAELQAAGGLMRESIILLRK
jgi:hypothetical protein